MKNKYENFCNYLKNSGKQTLTLTVEDIEKINNDYLPTSAKTYPAFWSNYRQLWLEAGYDIRNILKNGKEITFYRVAQPVENAENIKSPDCEETKCAYCDKTIPQHSIFCPFCGEKQINKCPFCEEPLQNEFKFCPNCGKSREQMKEKNAQNSESAATE